MSQNTRKLLSFSCFAKPGGVSVPVIVLLSASFIALLLVFRLLPAAVSNAAYPGYEQDAALKRSLSDGLVEFWRSGHASFSPALQRLVDYWRLWHAVKIGVTGLMVIVLIVLSAGLWHRCIKGSRVWGWAAGVSTVLLILAAGTLAANIQATAAPSVALLIMAPHSADLESTLASIKTGLTVPGSPEAGSAALGTLLGEVERYNWVMAVTAMLLGVLAMVVNVAAWRRRGAEPRVHRAAMSISVITAIAALLFLVLVVVSVVSALTPMDALGGVLGLG